MRVYAEPDTEESELGFRLFCVRKWVEIWGGDNTEAKEVDKVILTGAEVRKYFGKETTPREMKDQIIKLLDDWKGQQKEHEKPEKKTEPEK